MNGFDTLAPCLEVPADEEGLRELVTQKMPFGKYNGRLLIDLSEPYLVWLGQQGFTAIDFVRRHYGTIHQNRQSGCRADDHTRR